MATGGDGIFNGTGYTFLKWNGQYGHAAKFVVRDNGTGKQALFTPGRARDIVWASSDLANTLEMKNWQEFGDETVDDLDAIAF